MQKQLRRLPLVLNALFHQTHRFTESNKHCFHYFHIDTLITDLQIINTEHFVKVLNWAIFFKSLILIDFKLSPKSHSLLGVWGVRRKQCSPCFLCKLTAFSIFTEVFPLTWKSFSKKEHSFSTSLELRLSWYYYMNAKKLAFTLENVELKFTSDHDYTLPCFMDHHSLHTVETMNII